MKYQMNTTTENVKILDKFASKENTVFIRIFYKGKFVNYFFDPADVENLGLSNIFDSIDPDPDLIQARANWDNFNTLPTRKKRIAKTKKDSIKSLS
jgi:hypothetical protein